MKKPDILKKLSGADLAGKIDEYSEIVGDVLYGFEVRMNSVERKHDAPWRMPDKATVQRN